MKKIEALIIEDHMIVIEGLSMRLNKEPDLHVCGYAHNVADGIKAVHELNPDVVIVDMSLENSNGMDFVKDAKILNPNLPVIVLSMHDENLYAERAIRAGARGYIQKSQSFDLLIEGIRTVYNGGLVVSDHVKDTIFNRICVNQKDASESPVDLLSDREVEVFMLLAKGKRPRHIAEELFMSTGTVNTHFKRIKAKLNIKSMTELVELATQWAQDSQQH